MSDETDITTEELIAEGVRPSDALVAICIRDAARSAIATDIAAMRASGADKGAIEARQAVLVAALDEWLAKSFTTLRDRARAIVEARQVAVEEARRCVN